jgi:hypothetical protein
MHVEYRMHLVDEELMLNVVLHVALWRSFFLTISIIFSFDFYAIFPPHNVRIIREREPDGREISFDGYDKMIMMYKARVFCLIRFKSK